MVFPHWWDLSDLARLACKTQNFNYLDSKLISFSQTKLNSVKKAKRMGCWDHVNPFLGLKGGAPGPKLKPTRLKTHKVNPISYGISIPAVLRGRTKFAPPAKNIFWSLIFPFFYTYNESYVQLAKIKKKIQKFFENSREIGF